jgi:cysteinyl-tRNA synthetase
MQTHPLRLFNSLGRAVAEFQPLDADAVRVYSCGPTVYNHAHIGNLRAYVFVDTLRRTLAWKGYSVVHVINITDVGHLTSDADEGDDKMELAAERQKRTVWDIAAHYTEAFQADLARLNVLPPSLWSKATDHIQEMIAFARRLEDNGTTYVLGDGVYFDTSQVPDYGRLGLLDPEGQEAGKRVAMTAGKRNPTDFAIWRFSPPDKQRLMEWHTPWGVGAPGWHLECSVMSAKYLGRHFDIHTGGIDHRQVHHCNEIAQNQAFTGSAHPGADWWMHNEFLVLRDDVKMSKSKGNFLTLQSLVDRGLHPLAYRLFLLTAAYRSSLEFSWDAVAGARSNLRRMLLRIKALRAAAAAADGAAGGEPEWQRIAGEARYQSGGPFTYVREALEDGLSDTGRHYVERLDAAVSNDLHTPQALVTLGEVLDDKTLAADEALRLVALHDLLLGLRLLTLTPEDLALRPATATITDAEVEALLADRAEARKAKDFAAADALRDRLLAAGVQIKDVPGGTDWEWAIAQD